MHEMARPFLFIFFHIICQTELLYLPHTVINIDQRTVAALSNRYAIFELKQDLDNFQKSQ